MLEYTSPNSTSTSLLTDTWNCNFVSKFYSFINNSFKMKQVYHFLMILFIICFTTNLYSQSVPSYVPTNGLVGWWGFNGNAQDGSGNGNHGTVNGATLTTDRFGNPNSAFNFDGVDDWIQVDDNATLRPNHITISAWIYVNTPTINPIVTKTRIGNPFGPDGGEQYCIFQSPYNYQNTAGSFQIKRNGGCQNGGVGWYRIFQTNLPFSTGQWQHIVGTYDGDTMKLYNNGLLSGFQVPPSGPIDNCSNGTFNIGRGWVNYDFYNGKMDNLGMWNRALTQQEITKLYNAQFPTQTSLCLPALTTNSPISTGIDSVIVGGNILNDGGSSIVLRGVCYSTTPNPNMGNMRTEDGSGVGSFTSILRNLSPTMTYYARSYAKNTNGVVVYGNEVRFTTTASLPGLRCLGTPTVTDIDGNIYNTVQIGIYCWTQSNLKVKRYNNGDTIPIANSSSDWSNTSQGLLVSYNNDSSNLSIFGGLYNHYAVLDNRHLCPTGWHVPSDTDWFNLSYQIGYDNVGGSLKSLDTLPLVGGWKTPNIGAINTIGFSAIPGGLRDPYGMFALLNSHGYWWTKSTSLNSSLAYFRELFHLGNNLGRNLWGRGGGMSVRCVRDSIIGTSGVNSILPIVSTIAVAEVTATSAKSGGFIFSDGGSPIIKRGVAYATHPMPTLSDFNTNNGTDTGYFESRLIGLNGSTRYFIRSYATNSVGTQYGNQFDFLTDTLILGVRCQGLPSVLDNSGNSYFTVQIGNQCWMQSNLKTKKYANGDTIHNVINNTSWGSLLSGASAAYNNSSNNDSLFGKLYNHFTVTDYRGLCPTGWHIPSDAEWDTLESYLGGPVQSAKALMTTDTLASSTVSWNFLNWNNIWNFATNSSGFSALPGGHRDDNGDFTGLNYQGFFWSSSKEPKWNDPNSFWRKYRLLQYSSLDGSVYLHHGYGNPTTGFSVRCLINTLPQVNTTSNTNVTPSTALVTGEVNSDGGDQNTTRGFCYSTTSNPTISNDTTMNGTGAGVYSVTLHNLTPLTTYYVRAYATNSVGTSYGNELNFLTLLPSAQPCPGTPTVTDIDGNAYNTVQIGNQCWTQSNLKVSKYRNGDNIPTGLSNTDWQSTTAGAYAIYDNNPVNDGLYGKLYNHYAVMDNRGLCPTGWHVPTDGEWTTLENHLGGWSVAGGALKSTATQLTPGGWNSPNTGATNISGFSAGPGGLRGDFGAFNYLGFGGYWWSSSLIGPNAYLLGLGSNDGVVSRGNGYRTDGLSVRCLRD